MDLLKDGQLEVSREERCDLPVNGKVTVANAEEGNSREVILHNF